MGIDTEMKEAFYELGKLYYEANKDNEKSEFYDKISEIKACMDKESLMKLYKLSLEGKTQCESCGAIITSDSLFCNKCGGKIAPRDFSSLNIEQSAEAEEAKENVCPSCGAPLVEDAMFCEKCGTKVS